MGRRVPVVQRGDRAKWFNVGSSATGTSRKMRQTANVPESGWTVPDNDGGKLRSMWGPHILPEECTKAFTIKYSPRLAAATLLGRPATRHSSGTYSLCSWCLRSFLLSRFPVVVVLLVYLYVPSASFFGDVACPPTAAQSRFIL